MKKFLLAVCICLLFIGLEAQSELFYRNDNLKLWFEDDSTLFVEAQKVMQIPELQGTIKNLKIKYEAIASHFHYLDYDNDGDRDLIFIGKLNEPYIILFEKRDTSYALALIQKGVVLQTNIPNQGNPFNFTTYYMSCCGYYLDIITSFVCITYRNTSYFNTSSRALMYTGTQSPSRILPQPMQFRTVKVSELRMSPKVDKQSLLEGMHGWKGNGLGMFSPGATGIILGEERTQTNEYWYFVRMNNEPNIQIHSNRFTKVQEEIEDPQDCYTYGWIKAEEVEYFTR